MTGKKFSRSLAVGDTAMLTSREQSLGSDISLAPFGREDVKHIVAKDEGENEGPCWIICGRLNDGRWFYIEAGCDYTGWDCQAGGTAVVAKSKKSLIRFGLTQEARERMGLETK